MTNTKTYLHQIGIPEGFRVVRPEELEIDLVVYIWGSYQGKPKAYGPHLYKGESSRHLNCNFFNFNLGSYFNQPLDEILVVSKTIEMNLDGLGNNIKGENAIVLNIDGNKFEIENSQILLRNSDGSIIKFEENVKTAMLNISLETILYNLCWRVTMNEDITSLRIRNEILLNVKKVMSSYSN